ncbi:Mitochondrial carrier protein [Novymonas esmeraldas]|uniref:Mitochondrial carrier protein n=1 Tax=Novymonas esmeraldas TaxID=1808958 RepID=A0AAW0ERG5_9TRYP
MTALASSSTSSSVYLENDGVVAKVAEPSIASSIIATNAVTRNFSDLHAPTWFALLSANIGLRTLLFHPIQLAISRKRVTRESTPPTLLGLVLASYRGGRTSAYGATCKAGQYNFGQGGIRGCYRGVGAALLCNLLGETSYLFTLEAMKEYVARTGSGPAPLSAADAATPHFVEERLFAASSYSAAVGAMCGDLVALLLVSPLVLVCNRQMTAGYSMAAANAYTSVPHTFRTVWGLHQRAGSGGGGRPWRAERLRRGLSGAYQGLSAGLLRIPSSGCWWGLYTKSKEALYTYAAPTLAAWGEQAREADPVSTAAPTSVWRRNWLLSPTDNPLLNAAAGVVASVCTTLLFNPIAVIQTRQQSLPPRFWEERVAAGDATSRPRPPTWRSSLPFRRVYHVANDLVRKEGVRGFLKGAPANVSVAVLDGVIFTLLFEFTKLGSDVQFLEKRHAD